MSWRRPRNAQYPIFRSTRVVARGLTPGHLYFGKGLFAFRRQMQMKGFFLDERMQRNRGFARLGPFANSFHRQQLMFSAPMCMMHLSRKQYPAISLSNSLVIRRGHCALDLLSPSLSLSLYLSPPFSRGILSCTRSSNPFATPFRNSFGSWKPNDSGENVPRKILEVHVLPRGWMYFEGWFDVCEGRNAYDGYLCCEYKLYFASWTCLCLENSSIDFRSTNNDSLFIRMFKDNRRNNNSRGIFWID